MRSSVPSLKSALTGRLQSDAGLAGVQVSYGNPYPNMEEREAVFIGHARAKPWELVASMTQANEDYTLAILVSVVAPSIETAETLEARAYELAAVVTASIIDWRNTGYDGHAAVIVPGESEDDESLDKSLREASVTLSFDVKARV